MTETAIETEPEQSLVSGTVLDVLRRFAEDLARHGETLGLLGPREYPRLWTRHLLNSAAAEPYLGDAAVAADVGTGAGLPGLVLAAMRPEIAWHLIEPMERRAQWLVDESVRLGIGNVSVHQRPAQDIPDLRGVCDVVTSRAVAALKKLVPISAPLLRDGGRLALIKGRSAQQEIDAAVREIRRARLEDIRVVEAGVGVIPESTTVLLATVRR